MPAGRIEPGAMREAGDASNEGNPPAQVNLSLAPVVRFLYSILRLLVSMGTSLKQLWREITSVKEEYLCFPAMA